MENPNFVIAKIDSGGEEKKTRKVDDFTDTYDLIRPYDDKMEFKYEGHGLRSRGPDSSSSDEDDDDETKKKKAERPPLDTTDLIKYITQLRNSFGFDVDVILPSWLMRAFALYLQPVDVSLPTRNKYFYKAVKIAIDEINVDMEILTQKSKTYKAVEVVKAVSTMYPFFLTFLTLDMKEAAEAAAATTIQAIVYRPMYHQPWELQQWRVVKA